MRFLRKSFRLIMYIYSEIEQINLIILNYYNLTSRAQTVYNSLLYPDIILQRTYYYH